MKTNVQKKLLRENFDFLVQEPFQVNNSIIVCAQNGISRENIKYKKNSGVFSTKKSFKWKFLVFLVQNSLSR